MIDIAVVITSVGCELVAGDGVVNEEVDAEVRVVVMGEDEDIVVCSVIGFIVVVVIAIVHGSIVDNSIFTVRRVVVVVVSGLIEGGNILVVVGWSLVGNKAALTGIFFLEK